MLEAFHARLKGTFYGMLQWQHLDELWERVKAGQWFFYQMGEERHRTALSGDELAMRIDALDKLLREDHDFHLCGIVYADHVETAHPDQGLRPQQSGFGLQSQRHADAAALDTQHRAAAAHRKSRSGAQ